MNCTAYPLISVIIPVYNLENYIAKCIESVQNQTYDNIEIVLVNDGSTDNSEEVCSKYAQNDERIIYLTKENGGPSSARNKGIEIAKGEYIFFVDGDDYLATDTLEKLYTRIVTDHSELALCGVTRVGRDKRILKTFEPSNDVITGFQALKMAYREDNGVLFCSMIVNKLYQRALFEHIRFPEGKFHEDEGTVYKLLDQCSAISLVPEPFYYYVDRENSTMNLPYSVKQLDGIEASYQRYFYYKKKGGQYRQLLAPEGDGFAPLFFQSKQRFTPTTDEEKERVKEINRMAREICFDGFNCWSLPRKIKLLAPELYILLGHLKKKIQTDSQIMNAVKSYINADTVSIHNLDSFDEETYLILNHANSGAGIMTEILTCLGWLRYALDNGYILVVNMTTLFACYEETSRTKWDDYFNQPMLGQHVDEKLLKDIVSHKRYASCEASKTRSNLRYYGRIVEDLSKMIPPRIIFPDVRDFKQNTSIHKEFCDLYERYIHMNETVRKYVENEYEEILKGKGVVLGVIVRGSDYVQMKPKRHPVQPTVKDVINEAKEIRGEHPWDYLYLATEEKAIEEQFREAFPEKVLINKRCYYDGDYSETFLFEAKNPRENDQYLRNLEYFSSMCLLSKCDMLIGGLCGGSQGVMIMRGNNPYSYLHLFDLGNY